MSNNPFNLKIGDKVCWCVENELKDRYYSKPFFCDEEGRNHVEACYKIHIISNKYLTNLEHTYSFLDNKNSPRTGQGWSVSWFRPASFYDKTVIPKSRLDLIDV
jgi:hypothetical protein